MKILIAEDDPISRKILQFHLKKWGYEVIVCSDGCDAWNILREKDAPRLAILDWVMPKMEGIEVCREMRTLDVHPYIYIILLTSKTAREDVVEGLAAGADDYIAKPFHPSELEVRVRAGARIVQLQQDLTQALSLLEFQASHDSLTRLWNRTAIMETIKRELARCRRENRQVGIILLDIDHFKLVNDNYGHLTGDGVLREVAYRIVSSLRPYDFAGRYGGEEFIVVLPSCNLHDAASAAERLRLAFDGRPVSSSEGMLDITISLGVTASNNQEEDQIDCLIGEADEALYRAKKLGRNRVEIHSV